MTVSATGARYTYSGNGSSTAFSFPRLFFADTDLKVYVVSAAGAATLKTLAAHYSVSGAGDLAGGTVNFIVAPAVGETVVVYRETAATQGLDLDNVSAWPMTSIEAAFDRAVLLVNELRDRIDRMVGAPLTRLGTFDYTLPNPVAGQVLSINGDATGFLLVDQGSGGGGEVSWGLVNGDITDQADLQAALDAKQALNALLTMIAGLSAPGADRILFWDHSALSFTWLTIGTNISISGTTLNASGGAGSTDWGLIGGTLADQVDLQAALDDITGDIAALDAALSGKSNVGHGHAITDVTGLQAALDGKQASGSYATTSYVDSGLAGKAAASHDHAASEITSGVIATARLGSGTANSSKVLKGDSTWGDPPSSGGCDVIASEVSLSGASVTFNNTDITKTYKAFKIIFSNANLAASTSFSVQISGNNGGNWSTVDSWSHGSGAVQSSGMIDVVNAHVSSGVRPYTSAVTVASTLDVSHGAPSVTTGAINAIRFTAGASTFDGGTVTILGYH